MTAADVLARLKPSTKPNVIDLHRLAGLDVSDWAHFRGRSEASNPKSYNWSFEQPGELLAVCIWHPEIEIDNETIKCRLKPRRPTGLAPQSERNWKRRSDNLLEAVRQAYEQELQVRAIIVDGERFDRTINPKASRVKARLLDDVAWAITQYDYATRECVLVRGATPAAASPSSVDIELSAFEGTKRRAFILHRHREARLRREKIRQALTANGNRLICEVPNCEFDFNAKYGALGEGYIQVHHREMLSASPDAGRQVTLADLAIVCANCHAMIHRDGACRDLHALIP